MSAASDKLAPEVSVMRRVRNGGRFYLVREKEILVMTKLFCKLSFCFFVLIVAGLFIPQMAFCQTEKLGSVQYSPPKGLKKTTKENIVTFSELDEAAGKFCIITLYGVTAGTGSAQKDFTREWNNLVVEPLAAEANPKTETQAADGWTAIAGGTTVDFQGSKAAAFLTVYSGFGKTVSVLGVFNDESYLTKLVAFSSSLDIEKEKETIAVAPAAAVAPPRTEDGRLVIPMPTRDLTIADLAGEWGENAGITTTYVDRYTGAYAGFDSLHFSNKMTITADGGYYNDFFALQNGRKIKEKTSGTIAVAGRVIAIKETSIRKYVVRGWLELPDMTILKVCGAFYDDDVIPAEVFTNPEHGSNLNKTWVRKK